MIAARARNRPVEAVMLEDPAFWNYPGHLALGFRSAKPDSDGRFVFDCVPPQTLCLSLNSGMGISFHHATLVSVLPGEASRAVVTGTGWRVKGRFVAPEGITLDWEKHRQLANIGSADAEIRPPAESDVAAAAFWLVDFWDSEAGRKRAATPHRVKLEVSPDGVFTSEDTLAPGDYRVSVITQIGNFSCLVKVASPANAQDEFRDLGDVQLSN